VDATGRSGGEEMMRAMVENGQATAQEERTSWRQVLYWLAFGIIVIIVIWLLWSFWDRGTVDDAGDLGALSVVTVPNVVDLAEADARLALEEASFAVESIDLYDEYAEPGRVLRQEPEAGSEAAPGITVTIEVATGGELSEYPDPSDVVSDTPSVPDVVGTFRDTAESRLDSAGYRVSVAQAYSEDFPPGKVVFQSPPAGTAMGEDGIVSITVSLGKSAGQTAAVPDVVGETESRARSRLEAAGFEPYVIPRPDSDDPTPAGRVVEQWPLAGSETALGNKVFIVVGEK
jgi:serine/threonine-protein kinase